MREGCGKDICVEKMGYRRWKMGHRRRAVAVRRESHKVERGRMANVEESKMRVVKGKESIWMKEGRVDGGRV